MQLTDCEKATLDGEEGPARQKAMELLVKYGEALGAEKLVETNNICGGIVGARPFVKKFIAKGWDIDAVFSEFNLDSGSRLTIPPVKAYTCGLIRALDPEYWQMMGLKKETYDLELQLDGFCARVGIQLMGTCAPYLIGNVPVKGEHCAWMESSAVILCNSLFGACTNTEGCESVGAAMLVGRIPYWGYHLNENRKGTHLVNVDIELNGEMDWNLIGYYVGEIVQEQIPVFNGVHRVPNLSRLKPFGAALASSGGVEMYHIVGITPEAHDLSEAFGDKKPLDTLTYGTKEKKKAYENLTSAKNTNVDFVVLGCPHYAIDQIWEACKLLEGKRVHENTNLWIFTPKAIKSLADRMGYTKLINDAGGYLMTDTCPAAGQVSPKGTKVVATDSAKQAHYLPAVMGFETWFGSLEECIEAAITGKWRGELK